MSISAAPPDAYALSPMQRGMLFHCVEAGAPGDLYVEQLCCTLAGEVSEAAFASAWRIVLSRHAVLRTAFAWQGLRQPLQVVGPRIGLPLEILDWRNFLRDDQAAAVAELQTRERKAGFKLSRAPLLRLKLVRLGPCEHRLVWTWHHIILDAWSVPILLEEFFAAYAAAVGGQMPDWPEPPPFQTFIRWQQGCDLRGAEEFWSARLRGFARATPLEFLPPLDSGEAGRDYALEFLPLTAAAVEAISAAARRYRVTASTLVQGAWALLLSRYACEAEVLFGTAVSGRPPELPGVERMVGLTINTIPVRVEALPDSRLISWLQQLQQQQAEAQPHDHAALGEVQRWSELPAGTPLFESLLVCENFPVDKERFQGLQLALGAIEFFERADFPLTVTVSFGESRMGAGFDARRFDRAGMRVVLEQFRALLAAMSSNPSATLGELSLVSPAERLRLREWSAAESSAARIPSGGVGQPIHRRFERVAAASPHAPAVTFSGAADDETMSYLELDAAANRLAGVLRSQGVHPGARVAICGDASPGQIVAVLAVLKAGGAYVPLPAGSPPTLLARMVNDGGATLVLSSAELLESLRAAMPVPLLQVPTAPFNGAAALETRPPESNGENALAYLIFTSGSTGVPKAVAVTHASLGHLVDAQIEAFEIERGSRVLQFSSLSFDASVSEIFTALLAGAQLHVAPRQTLLPSREMVALLERWQITHLTLPPSVLARLPAADLPCLKTLVSAGEPCAAELVRRWGKGRIFLNAYGPTEGTVCATIGRPARGHRRPSIGRPMGRMRVYLLDAQLEPVGAGIVGELYLGGPGVASGYWRRPHLTAAAFLPDPFSEAPGSRMYRTGDRGRYLPNGEIDLLGRVDDQVKVRGYRVELGQIEAALLRDPAVKEAAAVAVGDDPSERAIVGFVVPKERDTRESRRCEWWPSLAEYLVYDELAYHAMTSDERRNESYRAAVRQRVPGRVVVDIGTGPEALLARFCVEAGARHVYAIELLESTCELARRRIAELGLSDRITLLHGDARTVSLPETAEVSVSEIVGAIGGCEGAAVILNHGRRLLAAGAGVIPARSTTLYAPVELPAELRDNPGFHPLPARYVEKIFAEIGAPFDLRLCVKGIDASALLAKPGVLEDLDFRGATPLREERWSTFRCERPGRLDGFLVWLTLDTGAGELIDILAHEHCWLPVFFPAFDPALPVRKGDTIEAHSGWHLHEDGWHPDYFVDGQVLRAGHEPVQFSHLSCHRSRVFRGAPFYQRFFAGGVPPQTPAGEMSETNALRERLKQSLPDYMLPSRLVPLDALPLNASGKVDRQALARRHAQPAHTPEAGSTTAGNELEHAVAEIWGELLGTKQVGRRQNFFDHGGHSLMLLEVQEKLRTRVGLEVAVTDLFKFSTVEALAQRLAALRGAAGSRESDHTVTAPPGRVAARREAIAERASLKNRLKETFKRKLR